MVSLYAVHELLKYFSYQLQLKMGPFWSESTLKATCLYLTNKFSRFLLSFNLESGWQSQARWGACADKDIFGKILVKYKHHDIGPKDLRQL